MPPPPPISLQTRLSAVHAAASGILLGKEHPIRLALACLLARGHLLIEDLPGVGKTTLAHTLAGLLGLGLVAAARAWALLLIFLALKQLEARAPRDGLAIVLLAYFLTLTQFFGDQSIPVAATMLGTVLAATATLASLTDPRHTPWALCCVARLCCSRRRCPAIAGRHQPAHPKSRRRLDGGGWQRRRPPAARHRLPARPALPLVGDQ